MNRTLGTWTTAGVAVVSLLVVGCSRDDGREAAVAPTPEQSSGRQIYDATVSTGVISGRTLFRGHPPAVRTTRMNADPYCVEANGGPVERAPYDVGADGGLAGAFVYASAGLERFSFAPATQPVVLDQVGCAYAPKVVGVRVGQPLEIRNDDATLHNVHALPQKSSGFNIGMPTKGMSAVRKFSTAEVLVRFKCDVHPWMEAYVGVVDNPFFAVTGADGSFRLEGLPAGTYEVRAVHYALGANVTTVEITDGSEARADFAFSD